MQIETIAVPLVKGQAANSTSASFTDPPDRLSEPTGDGIFPKASSPGGGAVPSAVYFQAYAVGANNDTFSVRLIGWSRVDGTTNQWTATTLAEIACICGAKIGIANGDVIATERYVDTMTIGGTTVNGGVGCDVVSPANDTKASAVVDLKGHQKYQFIYANTSTLTSMNVLHRAY